MFSSNQEPAYANLRMFQALGFTIAYMYSKFLCEYIKLYIAGAFVVCAVSLQTIVEIRVKRSDKKTIQGSKAEEAINYWDCFSLFCFFFTVNFRFLIRTLENKTTPLFASPKVIVLLIDLAPGKSGYVHNINFLFLHQKNVVGTY